MKRLLVTGGAGFIGSNFVRYILNKYPDYRVTAFDALTYAGNLDNFHDLWDNPNFQFIQGRIEDSSIVDNVARNVDAILNFAAESHNDRAILDPETAVRSNFNGVLTLLEAARKFGHERFLQVSCYDTQTRALTKEGFKSYEEIKEGDYVLSLNPVTGIIEEKEVEKVIVQDYDGDMIRFKSNRVDLLVTPNHRMFFTTTGQSETIRVESAAEISHRSQAWAPRGKWTGKTANAITVDGIGEVSAADLFYLCGMFLGDGFLATQKQERPNKTGLARADYLKRCRNEKGHFINPGKIGDQETTTITCHRIFFDVPENDKGRKRLEQTLENLGIAYSVHCGKSGEHIYFASKPWSDFFRQFGHGASVKQIPSWMLEHDASLLKALFDGLMDSDGHYPPGKNQPRFATSSQPLLCGVLELGFKLGLHPRFTTRSVDAQATLAETGRVIRPTMPAYMVFFRSENIGLDQKVCTRETYRGKIWCLRVKDNKNFIVERNGILLFCGNTDEVYGSTTDVFIEGGPLEPNQPYSAAKAGGELMVRAYNVTFGVPTIVTRGSNTYGPYHFPEKLIPLFITNAIDDLSLPVYGDGKQVREWMYVLDHCKGIDIAFHQGTPGEVYNVGGDPSCERYNIDVTKQILSYLNKPESLIRYVQDRPGHDRRYAMDCNKLRALGFAPETDFEKRLEETVRWYVENESWWRKIKEKQAGYKEFMEKWYAERK